MGDIHINDKSTQRWSNTPEEREKLEKRTASGRGGISHWKKPFHILKPPLSDFLLASVNTERELNVLVLLHTKGISATRTGGANRNLLTALGPGG
jgi:hypothetical protein